MVTINHCRPKCNKIGRLKHKISILSSTEVRKSGGGRTQTWTELTTDWAEIKPKHRNELLEAENLEQQTSHKIAIRYRSDIDITASLEKYRIKLGTRFFKVVSAINLEEENRYIEFDCLEGVKFVVTVS